MTRQFTAVSIILLNIFPFLALSSITSIDHYDSHSCRGTVHLQSPHILIIQKLRIKLNK